MANNRKMPPQVTVTPSGAGRGKQLALQSAPHYTTCRGEPSKHILELQKQALAKAQRANLIAEGCQAAGDHPGFVHWRKRAAIHQAIAWAAMPPQEVGP